LEDTDPCPFEAAGNDWECEWPRPRSPEVRQRSVSYDESMPGPVSEWVVLLLGGASGVGKSRMSSRLARRLEVNLTEIDDFQIALETATTPSDLPLLHFWRTNFDKYMSWSDERRVEHHVRVCREVFLPVMRAVIADHLETRTPVVYEGDFLLPEMATMAKYGDEPNDGRVRALFVSETDEAQLAANYLDREAGVEPERVRASWLFDAFLRSECGHHGLPIVDARPWDSVVERALAALV
jgi:2-phosphoglycerate kinase